MSRFEIARLDENGVIVAVDPCSEADYRTDSVARTVRLDEGHDMHKYIGHYRWNFNKHTFEALSLQAMDVAERDTAELVEGLVETVEDLIEYAMAIDDRVEDPNKAHKKFKRSKRMKRVLKEWRRGNPRKNEVGEE